MLHRLISLAAVLALASHAPAHEFWIQPLSYFPESGQNLGIRLMVGDGFPGEARPRDPTKLEQFIVAGTIGSVPIPGNDGQDPAGIHRFERPGVQALGYRSKNSRIELPAAQFEDYLKEEGLEAIIQKRKDHGESEKAGTELFSRCAKTLVCVGSPAAGDLSHQTSLHFPLEITPIDNPYLKKVGETMDITVTNQSGPVAGAVVTIFCSTDPKARTSVHTDAQGKASITLTRPGIWLANCIQMTEAPAGSGADWQSLWASLTFEVRAESPAKPATPAPAQAPVSDPSVRHPAAK